MSKIEKELKCKEHTQRNEEFVIVRVVETFYEICKNRYFGEDLVDFWCIDELSSSNIIR